ncbi:5-oxoprolinase subunit B family protein [Kineosporia succinea]|uniref:KipI family sensor histidine kinase inhibitor n=1 Tax=Kineosporia succinea TaxID=84632 RepID=A0ABT9P1K5_9ACTN|nr:allophanate hydrolase subunit 1 [Kineosporia succinea]MDP9826568.1 KipI family sensor histidine kinase inhibitor [Kineosporia succinea]
MTGSLIARPAGERGYLVDVPEADPARVAAALRVVAGRRGVGLVDVVPGMSTVLVVLSDALPGPAFRALLAEVGREPVTESGESGTITIDVRYDGPDLAEVASLSGLSESEVVRVHTGTDFRAAFSGFAPGFVYLTGVPESLRVPRRAAPRAALPGGSVALADQFTAVYPRRSPGGWRLIGTTDVPLWDETRDPPAVIRPGMTVRFRAVG